MARIPVVGTQDLHTAQLSPEVRRILHRRAVRANRREYAPVLQADRAALGGINREYQNEAGSVRGAAQMTEQMLQEALRGLKASGLSGTYLKQAVQELTSRQGDAAAAVPFLLSDAREARSKAVGEAQQQITQDRASMLQGIAQDFNSSLESARSKASTVLKEQEDQRQAEAEDHEPKFDPTAIQNAKLALKDSLSQWAQNPMVPTGEKVNGEEVEAPLQQINPLKTKADYLRYAQGLVEAYDGFDLHDVWHVIAELLHDRKRHEHEGRLVQPGVPGPGRG
jgi:hypothetical protein